MEQKNTTAGLSSGSGVDTSDLTAHQKKNGKLAQAYNSDSANEWYYKKQEAEMNHRYALDAWQRENEYNSPENIAKRLRAAGINPRVAFGNGSGTGGSIDAGSASGSYGKSDVTQNTENAQRGLSMASGLLNDGMNVAQSIGGFMNMRANTQYTNARTSGLNIENRYKESQILHGLEKQKAETLQLQSQANLTDRQRQHLDKQEAWIDQQIEQSKQNILQSQQEILESKSQTALNTQGISESKTRSALNEQNVSESKTRSALNEQNARESEKRMQKMESEIAQINARNTWFDRFGFYPPTGDDWQSALIGLGTKGIGKFADWLLGSGHSEQDAKKVPPKLIVEYVDASPNEQKSIEKRIDEHIKRFGNIE